MQPSLHLTLRPSWRLTALLVAAHCGAAVVVGVVNAVWWLKLVLIAAIFLSAAWHVRRLHGAQRIVHLRLHADGLLEFTRLNGQSAAVAIHPHSTVTPLLTVVLLKRQRHVEALVVLADMLVSEDFRKLRLWLRWRAVQDAPVSLT